MTAGPTDRCRFCEVGCSPVMSAADIVVQRPGHERRGRRQAVDGHQAAPRQLRQRQAAAVPRGGALRRALCAPRHSIITSSLLCKQSRCSCMSHDLSYLFHKASADPPPGSFYGRCSSDTKPLSDTDSWQASSAESAQAVVLDTQRPVALHSRLPCRTEEVEHAVDDVSAEALPEARGDSGESLGAGPSHNGVAVAQRRQQHLHKVIDRGKASRCKACKHT